MLALIQSFERTFLRLFLKEGFQEFCFFCFVVFYYNTLKMNVEFELAFSHDFKFDRLPFKNRTEYQKTLGPGFSLYTNE